MTDTIKVAMQMALDALAPDPLNYRYAIRERAITALREALAQPGPAIKEGWQPIATAPKDGTTVLALLEGSDIPKAIKWCELDHFLVTDGAGWYMPWDGTKIQPNDGPRYWMYCPDDPDAAAPEYKP